MGAYDGDNVFAKILDGRMPCYKIFEVWRAPYISPPPDNVDQTNRTFHSAAGKDSFRVPMICVYLSHVSQTEHSLAILDAFPVAEGHCLLVAKFKGAVTLMDMPEVEAAAFLSDVQKLAKIVKNTTACEGVSILQNNGSAAGQVVMHPHFHVVPRVDADGVLSLPEGSKSMITAERGAGLCSKMQEEEERLRKVEAF